MTEAVCISPRHLYHPFLFLFLLSK
uniref:Uncharacterized protein n=1 Tax=Anguilla anguilla TaxID=7936 RepID=A0A0E9PVX8_ANGAN